MAAHAAPAARSRPPLRRDPSRRLIGGVCAGVARWLGVDPLLVRVAMIAAALVGAGVPVYVVLWILIPAAPGVPARRLRTGRGSVEVGLGVGLLVLSVLLTFRGLGWWWLPDGLVWPLVLVAAGAALLWRGAAEPPPPPAPRAAKPAARAAPHVANVSRTGVGIALVVAAGLAFLQGTGALSAARDAVLAALVAAAVLSLIFAPWIVRLVRSLGAERAERVRSQERAEVAAHLHDSVLQTLALVQRRADDPRAVATLARAQERELRAWLSGRTPDAGAPRRLASALEAAADEVERDHGVALEVVAVGDAELDSGGEAIVAAAREAMVNAAKFGGGEPVSVYAEAGNGRLQVFVRDRGPGFDPAGIDPDRRGVRESIVGRMERNGGRALIHSAPGAGTEVELVLERK